MNVLFVLFTLPHLSQTSMYSDFVNEFKNKGHNVYPMAPLFSESPNSYISIENEIEVVRVKTFNVFSKKLFIKGISNLLISYQFRRAFKSFWEYKHIDLVIVSTPSIMFADFIVYLKKIKASKVYLMQKDIFPQNAVDLGFIKKDSLIYKFFKYKEYKLLTAADIVGCTSLGNINYFLKNYSFLDKNKFQLLYNNSKLLFCPDGFKSQHKIHQDMFRVVFGGNMGKPQQIENILNLAKRTLYFKDILFIIIGIGTETQKLKIIAEQMKLSNLKFMDPLPREDYFKLISSCNLGLISLHQDFTVPNTPMKLNDYLNAGIPVLALIDRFNDLGELLVKNKMGKYAYSDSFDMILEQFISLYEDKDLCKELGKNGYVFCVNNLSVEKAYINLLSHINNI